MGKNDPTGLFGITVLENFKFHTSKSIFPFCSDISRHQIGLKIYPLIWRLQNASHRWFSRYRLWSSQSQVSLQLSRPFSRSSETVGFKNTCSLCCDSCLDQKVNIWAASRKTEAKLSSRFDSFSKIQLLYFYIWTSTQSYGRYFCSSIGKKQQKNCVRVLIVFRSVAMGIFTRKTTIITGSSATEDTYNKQIKKEVDESIKVRTIKVWKARETYLKFTGWAEVKIL